MTRSDLIDHLAVAWKVPRARAEQLVAAVFDSMEGALKRGERVEIRGFGSFELRHYDGYIGRNPRTGATTTVKPKKAPFFKVGRELRQRINPAPRNPPPDRALDAKTAKTAETAEPAAHTTPPPALQTEVRLGAS